VVVDASVAAAVAFGGGSASMFVTPERPSVVDSLLTQRNDLG
jgi:hypothetical protein